MLKTLRTISIVLATLALFGAILVKDRPVLFYLTAVLWIISGVFSFLLESEKRSKAKFIVYDKGKTIANYALSIAFVTLNFVQFSSNADFWDTLNSSLFYLSLLLSILLSRSGDSYYLFDAWGIKTLRKSWDFKTLTQVRITDGFVEVDSANARNELVIKRGLLNPQMVDFLVSKIPVVRE